jgi:hypothetical protein
MDSARIVSDADQIEQPVASAIELQDNGIIGRLENILYLHAFERLFGEDEFDFLAIKRHQFRSGSAAMAMLIFFP